MKSKNTLTGYSVPEIKTEIPGPKTLDLLERARSCESPASSGIKAGESPICWERAYGANIEDVDGNIYIDMGSGFSTTVCGHANPNVVKAIQKQSEKLLHAMGAWHPHELRIELAEKLAEIMPGDLTVSHIASTGSEAVEIALKAARLHTNRQTIISFHGGYHGRTMGALSVSTKNSGREPWQSSIVGTTHVPYASCYRCPFKVEYPSCNIQCTDYLDHIINFPDSGVSNIAAVILEPAQGMGGWIVPPPEFLKRVSEICNQNDILLIVDEIITGFGRTGKMFGVEHSGITPDIMVLGKGIASGFPISAITMTKDVADSWESKQHTSTFLGNPVGCAAALASIREIEENGLVERASKMGATFHRALVKMANRYSIIGDVRSLGLLSALEFVKDKTTKEPAIEETSNIVNAAIQKGLLASWQGGSYNNCLRLAPPLIISQEQLDFSIEVLDSAISEIDSRS